MPRACKKGSGFRGLGFLDLGVFVSFYSIFLDIHGPFVALWVLTASIPAKARRSHKSLFVRSFTAVQGCSEVFSGCTYKNA